jgi:hypothetical protein
MSVEIKLASGKGTMEQRIADRLKSSGDQRADFTTKKRDGPTRTFTHGFHAGHRPNPGTEARECGPQEQRHHSSATTQDLMAYKMGRGGIDE